MRLALYGSAGEVAMIKTTPWLATGAALGHSSARW
jgi:hypothetical protein